jgi:SAM-dependent methyltransferase
MAWRHPGPMPSNPSKTQLGIYMDQRRALRGYRAATRQLGRASGSAVDIGGGNGRLLRPFMKNGFDCYVVDPNPTPIDGVTRLCNIASELEPDRKFDVILCNHTLEHLLDPVDLLKTLAKHTAPGGVLHVEVPDEVWGGLPLPATAAQHVNYFTKQTAEILLKLSGWRPIWSKTGPGSYGEIAIPVTVIIAQAAEGPLPVSDAEFAAASRDSEVRLRADSELRREHLQVLARLVTLQASSMLMEGHVITNTRGIFDRVTTSRKVRG